MREFLKGLELDKEVIDNIMAEHGKHLNAEKNNFWILMNSLFRAKQLHNSYGGKIFAIGQVSGKLIYDNESNNNKSLENMQNVTNENKNLKAQVQMSDSNVKKEFSKFVTSEVMANVNDETDFATALENYKKDNPQYFGDTVVKKVQSSPNLNGGTKPQTTNDIFNSMVRGV